MNGKLTTTIASFWAGLGIIAVNADGWPGEFEGVVPTPTANLLNAVAFEGGAFHALGNLGTHLASTDGANWSVEPLPGSDDLWSYAELGDTRVISGLLHNPNSSEPLTGSLITSTDGGITWHRQVLDEGTYIFGQSVNGKFLGTGYANTRMPDQRAAVFSSPDGVVWSEVQLPTEYASLTQPYLTKIVYGNGTYVAAGYAHPDSSTYTPFAISSSDGSNWNLSSIAGDKPVTSIAFGNQTFVTIGGFAGTTVATSSDGIDWNVANDSNIRRSIIFAAGSFYARSLDSNSTNIFQSIDGLAWTTNTLTESIPINLGFGGGTFVAVGDEGAIFSSSDAQSWTWQVGAVQPPSQPEALHFGGGQFVVTDSLGQAPLVSSDGTNWNYSTFSGDVPRLFGIANGGGTYVAIGKAADSSAPVIANSGDAQTWTTIVPPTGVAKLNGIVYGGSAGQEKFVILAAGNVDQPLILTSGDGQIWNDSTPVTSPFVDVRAIGLFASEESLFLQTTNQADETVMLESSDGMTWTGHPANPPTTANTPIFCNGMFFAGDTTIPGILQRSTDALQWTTTQVPAGAIVKGVAYGFGLYVGIADSPPAPGSVLVSEDALHWRELAGLDDRVWQGVAYGNHGFNLLSRGGGILRLDLSDIHSRLAAGNLEGGTMSFNLLSQPGDQIQLYQSTDLDSWNPIRVIDVTGEVTPVTESTPQDTAYSFWKVEPVSGSTP